MRRAVLFCCSLLLFTGCDAADTDQPAPPKPKQPAAAKSAAPAPSKPRPVHFEAEDGTKLSGDLYLAKPSAPAVVFLHRLYGTRQEFAPLLERLAKLQPAFTLLAFDLRGHGASGGSLQKDGDAYLPDVTAAITFLDDTTKGKLPSLTLVGSSLGAALAVHAAIAHREVAALALLSPGASIGGLKIAQPYGIVRDLPTFIAGAERDTVTVQPMTTLENTAKAATVKRYAGDRHAAEYLAAQRPELWVDLAAWLETVYDVRPGERRWQKRKADEPVKRSGS